MADYRIIVDSSCDLPKNLPTPVDVHVADLVVSLGERVYRDRMDITTEELFSKAKKSSLLPSTSPLNVNDLKEIFLKEGEENKEIFFLTISKELSPLYEKALFARDQVENKDHIHILDSKQISAGIGLLAIGLYQDLEKKLPLKEVLENHEKRVEKVHMSFVIDTLDYLNHGGRCSGLTFFIGSKLQLHPIVQVDDGKMAVRRLVTKKNIDKAIEEMVDVLKENLEKGNVDLSYPILIPTASCQAGLKKMLHRLEDLVGDKILFPVEASAVVASHSGPNAIGLSYMLRQKED